MQSESVCGFTMTIKDNSPEARAAFHKAKTIIEDCCGLVKKKMRETSCNFSAATKLHIRNHLFAVIYADKEVLLFCFYHMDSDRFYLSASPEAILTVGARKLQALAYRECAYLDHLANGREIPIQHTLEEKILQLKAQNPDIFQPIEQRAVPSIYEHALDEDELDYS